MKYEGMEFKELNNGQFEVSSDNGRFSSIENSFYKATSWINNMADNHDIAREFLHRICSKFNCNVYGEKN